MRGLLLIGLSVLLFSCGRMDLTPKDCISYVQSAESGLRVEATFMDYKFQAQHLPGKYWEAKELETGIKKPASDSFLIFKLYMTDKEGKKPLSRTAPASREEFMMLMEYLDFGAQPDFYLLSGKDSIPCAQYHYERTYDMVPYDCINLAFVLNPEKEYEDDVVLVYNDAMLGIGKQYFVFNKKDLNRATKITLTEK